MKKFVWLLIVPALALVACSGSPAPTVTVTVAATSASPTQTPEDKLGELTGTSGYALTGLVEQAQSLCSAMGAADAAGASTEEDWNRAMYAWIASDGPMAFDMMHPNDTLNASVVYGADVYCPEYRDAAAHWLGFRG
jgi:hypothetical protein